MHRTNAKNECLAVQCRNSTRERVKLAIEKTKRLSALRLHWAVPIAVKQILHHSPRSGLQKSKVGVMAVIKICQKL
jgi:hypothetical protein